MEEEDNHYKEKLKSGRNIQSHRRTKFRHKWNLGRNNLVAIMLVGICAQYLFSHTTTDFKVSEIAAVTSPITF